MADHTPPAEQSVALPVAGAARVGVPDAAMMVDVGSDEDKPAGGEQKAADDAMTTSAAHLALAVVANAVVSDSLLSLLERFKLTSFAGALKDMGAESPADLAYVQDADLAKIGMPLVPRRKMIEAAGCCWRAAAAGKAQGPGSKVEGDPTLASPMPPDELSLFTEDTQRESEEAELKQLTTEMQDRMEDFAEANSLDPASRVLIMSLPARVCLRVMGLIGSGNTFLLGVRPPAAAVAKRAQAAAGEEAGKVPAMKPYEDWSQILESFATANNLGQKVRDSLQELSRSQALRVMGFTSGLRFNLPDSGTDAEEEVRARIQTVLDERPLQPVMARIMATPRPLASGGATLLPASATPAAAAPATSANNLAQALMGLVGQMAGALPSLGGGGAAVPRPAPLLPPRSLPPAQSGPRAGSYGSSAASHPPRRVRSRTPPRGVSHLFDVKDRDGVPMWRRIQRTFIKVNDLDERSSQVLGELPKLQAMRVMGLVGKENSFMIRGARNPSAAVMMRLNRANSNNGDGDEPFAGLSKIMEDFITVNNLDDRGAEAVRSLPSDHALNVMGFTEEKNSFFIKGTNNPSAALMSRMMAAKRHSGDHRHDRR